MITIITALRGDRALSTRWDARVHASGHPVIAAVNNAADKAMVDSRTHGHAIEVQPFSGGDEVDRINYISGVYATLLQQVDTPRVVFWDDDMVPPTRGIRLLEVALDQKPDAAGIVSVYPFKEDPAQAVLFWRPFEYAAAPMKSVPNRGIHRVWAGGRGFSIWRTDVLKQTAPWETKRGRDYAPGWDRELAVKLTAMGLETFVHAGLICRHDPIPA